MSASSEAPRPVPKEEKIEMEGEIAEASPHDVSHAATGTVLGTSRKSAPTSASARRRSDVELSPYAIDRAGHLR